MILRPIDTVTGSEVLCPHLGVVDDAKILFMTDRVAYLILALVPICANTRVDVQVPALCEMDVTVRLYFAYRIRGFNNTCTT